MRTNSKAENKQTKDIGRESSHDLGFLLNLANEREVRQRCSSVVNNHIVKYIETLREYMARINFV